MPFFPGLINMGYDNIFRVAYFPVYKDNICHMWKNKISNNNKRLKEKTSL